MPGIGIGHEDVARADLRTVVTEDAEPAVDQFDRLRRRSLENPHPTPLQGPAETTDKLTWAKAAAEAIDHTSCIDVLARSTTGLQLPGRKKLEEGTSLLSDQRHQRSKAALLHEVIGALKRLEIGLCDGRRHGTLPHG